MKVGLGWALNWCGSDFILVSLWLYLPAEARADTQKVSLPANSTANSSLSEH